MNSKIMVPVITGVVMVILISVFLIPQEKSPDLLPLDSSYDVNFELQSVLESHGIMMSNPLRITGESVQEHCKFFDDPDMQQQIQYCTSTELRDNGGVFLGNIHMAGTSESAQTAIAIVQSDPFVSQESDIAVIFDAMINSFVCNCWQEKSPGEFATVSDWVDAAKNHHLEAERITSKSKIDGLAEKQILLEITTNTEGYLWKLLIGKYE